MNEGINKLHTKKTFARKMAGCAGKAQYDTFTKAQDVVRAIESHSNKHVKPYKCQYCGKYHIGRPAPKRKP